MADVTVQFFKPSTVFLGTDQLNWGLTAFDRNVNRKLAIFKKWGI